jgi:hypothetical protein
MQLPYEPSRIEISKACRDIQKEWSQNEELRRRCAVDQVWHSKGVRHVLDAAVKVPTEE